MSRATSAIRLVDEVEKGPTSRAQAFDLPKVERRLDDAALRESAVMRRADSIAPRATSWRPSAAPSLAPGRDPYRPRHSLSPVDISVQRARARLSVTPEDARAVREARAANRRVKSQTRRIVVSIWAVALSLVVVLALVAALR